MKILAIETSCDDTGIAILNASGKGDFKVLSNVVASQIEIHKKYGGVYPAMAKREHQKNLVPVFVKALKEAGLLKQKNGLKYPDLKTILTGGDAEFLADKLKSPIFVELNLVLIGLNNILEFNFKK